MFPDEFDYHRAETVAEAVALLEEHTAAETELLAGGHSLLPTMKAGLASPDVVVDVGHVAAMSGIEDRGDHVSVGANTTYADLDNSDLAWEAAPALAEAAHHVGDVQVRNRGTVGGNLAHADPAADLPGAVVAADATVVVRNGDGERSVDAEEFFLGMYTTDLDPDEILTRIEVPRADAGAYAKKPSPTSGYALVGVAASLHTDGDRIASASVGANGAVDHGVRLPSVEDALAGAPLDDADAFAAAASHAVDDLEASMLLEDRQASGEFRAQLLEVYAERAVAAAAERAGGQSAGD